MTHGPRRARSSLDCRVLGLARWQGPADTSAAPVHLTDPFMSAAHIQRDALASKPKAQVLLIRSPLSPRRPSHVSVAADLPPDLSSNASDALRAARADDRLYDLLCLNRLERVINTHGDILVSNAYQRLQLYTQIRNL